MDMLAKKTVSGPKVLFRNSQHQCLVYTDLVEGDGVQANQFLILHEGEAALIDPGGDLSYNALSIEISRYCDISRVKYLFASHQDPDIISSLDRWLMRTNAKVVTSHLWSRFLPHLVSDMVRNTLEGNVFDRIIAVPDEGMKIPFGNSHIACLPAHFMHSVGNLHFYDPVSKILFSGDMGGSFGPIDTTDPVEHFESHIPSMLGFHQRYMGCSKVCRLWANMIRKLDVEMLVPQHGRCFVGKEMIHTFLDWISQLQCGTDLMTQENFSFD